MCLWFYVKKLSKNNVVITFATINFDVFNMEHKFSHEYQDQRTDNYFLISFKSVDLQQRENMTYQCQVTNHFGRQLVPRSYQTYNILVCIIIGKVWVIYLSPFVRFHFERKTSLTAIETMEANTRQTPITLRTPGTSPNRRRPKS